jgi:hypothetical protein
MAHLSMTARRNILLVVTALVVCYVRHIVQYGKRPWTSGWEIFLVSWFLHYLAVALVGALVYALSLWSNPYFFPDRPARTSGEAIHETMVNVCLTLLVAAVVVWFLSLWQGNGDAYE